jgi:hypothetical protein
MTDKNKKAALALGIEWNDITGRINENGTFYEVKNIDFTQNAKTLIDAVKKTEYWNEFSHIYFYVAAITSNGEYIYYIPEEFVLNPESLLDKFNEFMEGRK